jgi:hypothetical protein
MNLKIEQIGSYLSIIKAAVQSATATSKDACAAGRQYQAEKGAISRRHMVHAALSTVEISSGLIGTWG